MQNTTCCIIVTYNRLDLLKKCVNAVRNQSLSSFDIICVNNGSTDGTKNWLELQGDIDIVNQENLGGSGGFHNGMVYAYKKGYNRFWIMDDDGIPDKDCFKILSEYMDKGLHYVAPSLKDFEGNFHLPQFRSTSFSRIVNHCGGPFNGILLSRVILETVGVPNSKFFIWGDEYEYINRIRNAGFFLGMSLDAIHNHKQTTINGIPTNRLFNYYRNLIWIDRLNSSALKREKAATKLKILQAFLKEMRKLRFNRATEIIKAYKAGYSADYYELCKAGEIDKSI